LYINLKRRKAPTLLRCSDLLCEGYGSLAVGGDGLVIGLETDVHRFLVEEQLLAEGVLAVIEVSDHLCDLVNLEHPTGLHIDFLGTFPAFLGLGLELVQE
jgi:hypothetical protein